MYTHYINNSKVTSKGMVPGGYVKYMIVSSNIPLTSCKIDCNNHVANVIGIAQNGNTIYRIDIQHDTKLYKTFIPEFYDGNISINPIVNKIKYRVIYGNIIKYNYGTSAIRYEHKSEHMCTEYDA
jgi:hypothetical protein